MNKKGQVTIFIILAIIVVVVGVSFFVFKDTIRAKEIPSNFAPIERSFLDCVEENALMGISILKSRGGYMEMPEFIPGSRYMPFSSELDFFGVEIPYWHYVSGNNIDYVQVPELEEMESRLENYLVQKISNCDMRKYEDNGIVLDFGIPIVDLKIKDDLVLINVDMSLLIENGDESFLINDHSVEINSKLGSLYKDAKEVYNIEEESFFLENYSIDVLRNYLPVDGVEISCSPLNWDVYTLYEEFGYALESNIFALKNKGVETDYFALNLPIESDLKFITFSDWPNTFEVSPGDSSTLIANPVGNQAGLGILGFCYVPYHFVYNVRYPVLVQVSEGEEIFQFPIVVLIEGNVPRVSRGGESNAPEIPNLCEESNSLTKVSLYNSDLEKVDGEVSFECFSSTCDLGITKDGFVEGNLPQCVNGKMVVNAEGYKSFSSEYTSIEEGEMIVVLEKEYEKKIELVVGGVRYNKDAVVSFISEKGSRSIIYPSQNSIVLGEGEYDIQVQLYENSNLTLPSSTREECYDIPRAGVGGLLGLSKQECVEVDIHEQIISNVLVGGGNDNYYFLESELEDGTYLILDVNKLNVPKSLEELQQNYLLFETQGVGVSFR